MAPQSASPAPPDIVGSAKRGEHGHAFAALTGLTVESEIASGSRAFHVGYAMILPKVDGEPLKVVMNRASELGALTSLDVTYFEHRPWPDLLKLMPEIDVLSQPA